ncbi:hypothetical protein ACQKKK_13250 [Peribacillus sp. NPDC006672]
MGKVKKTFDKSFLKQVVDLHLKKGDSKEVKWGNYLDTIAG